MEDSAFDSRIRLRHLRCFVTVAQEGNMGRAAQRLHLTQPAVSKTLAELEELAGPRLFERGRQGARLTPAGREFLVHAIAVLDALDAAAQALAHRGVKQKRPLRVAALPSVADDLLAPVVTSFCLEESGTGIVLQTATNTALMAMLNAGEADLALGRMSDPEMMVGLSFELLYMEPLVLAARIGHPLLRESAVTLAQALAYPLVVPLQGTVPRQNAEAWLAMVGLTLPGNCIETMSGSLASQLTRQSDALWCTPAGAVRAAAADGSLALAPLPPAAQQEAVGLLRRADAASTPLADEFIRLLRLHALARQH
jgi:DNA-binding transcriptional LysR family regulator